MDSIVFKGGSSTLTFRTALRSGSDDPYAGGSFVVELEGEGLRATRSVFMSGFDWHALAAYFADLAESWMGWDGAKLWNSVEHDLEIAAVADHLGHCKLTITVQDGPTPTWVVRLEGVTVDAGEDLRNLANQLSAWTSSEAAG